MMFRRQTADRAQVVAHLASVLPTYEARTADRSMRLYVVAIQDYVRTGSTESLYAAQDLAWSALCTDDMTVRPIASVAYACAAARFDANTATMCAQTLATYA